MRRLYLVAFVAFVAAAGVGAAIVVRGPFWQRDLTVHVENAGDAQFQSVVLGLEGTTYELGSISPGRSASQVVQPLRSAGFSLTVRSLRGTTEDFTVPKALGPQMTGDITVRVTHDRLVAVDADLNE